ncbi:MAG: lytic transglycosylase domain-containing protein, partial [Sphingobium sp.]
MGGVTKTVRGFRSTAIGLVLGFAACAAITATHAAETRPTAVAPASIMPVSTAPAAPVSYSAIFDKLDSANWSDAKAGILTLPEQDAMRPYLLAKLYLAKDSPRAELFDILDLLAKAPYLPQSEQLARLASRRGAQILPDRPQIRQLLYTGASPQRGILKPIK